MTAKQKDQIVLKSLADLFRQDAAEIAVDPKYAKPEQSPPQIVGKLMDAATEIEDSCRDE